MKFQVEYTKRAIKDLKSFTLKEQQKILDESIILETSPFPYKKKIKRIRGIKFPCYRLRIEHQQNSFRLFFGIEKQNIYVLRIVSKKDADKIITSIRKIDFPPM